MSRGGLLPRIVPQLSAAVGSTRWLATNSDELPRLHVTEGFQNQRNEGPEFLDAIGLGQHQNHTDVRGAEVLLKRKVLVYGEQGLEMGRHHEAQELAVACGGPPHIDDVAHVVPDQISL